MEPRVGVWGGGGAGSPSVVGRVPDVQQCHWNPTWWPWRPHAPPPPRLCASTLGTAQGPHRPLRGDRKHVHLTKEKLRLRDAWSEVLSPSQRHAKVYKGPRTSKSCATSVSPTPRGPHRGCAAHDDGPGAAGSQGPKCRMALCGACPALCRPGRTVGWLELISSWLRHP